MITDKTVRMVHRWAAAQGVPVDYGMLQKGLGVSKSTAHNAMNALMRRHCVEREMRRQPGSVPVAFYTVTANTAQVEEAFPEGLEHQKAPPLYAAAPSVFHYGERCRLAHERELAAAAASA